MNKLYTDGLRIRRDVLGDAYVDKSVANATDFTRPFQDLVTEYCWGAIWSRPGLDRQTRSLLNIAMLTALNRPNEVQLHVRGARNQGIAKETIQEVLLQASVYCGVPAGLDSFKIAQRVFDEESTEG